MNNTDKRYTTVQSVGKSCVGCRSCEQKCPKNCISIMPDKEGFLYPVIDNDKCIGRKVCVNSCPAVNMPQKRQPISVYALKNKDKKRILARHPVVHQMYLQAMLLIMVVLYMDVHTILTC